MEISELVSKNLRKIREEKDLTQRFIAENCDVSTQTIRDIEAGRRGLSLELLGRIAQLLGIKASTLLESGELPPVLQMPVSKTIQKLASVPDLIYDLAVQVPLTSEAWKTAEIALKIAIKKQEADKEKAKNKA